MSVLQHPAGAPQAPAGAVAPVTAADLPPPTNRGAKSQFTGQFPVRPDWVTATGPFDSIPLAAWPALLSRWIGVPVQLVERRGVKGFTEGRSIVESGSSGEPRVFGVLAWGGVTQAGRIMVTITGMGCESSYVVGHGLSNLAYTLRLNGFRLTRCDLCADFLGGELSVATVRDAWREGAFNGRGRPPRGRFIDDFGSGDGCTMYVGTRQSERELCVYEKGKQLGSAVSEWVRFEYRGRRRRDCELSWAMIEDPRGWLAGACPFLAPYLQQAAPVVRVRRVRQRVVFDVLVAEARRCYGQVINLLQREVGAYRAFALLARVGVPRRLAGYDYRTHELAVGAL